MKETRNQHRGPIAAMLMAKALARWEGEGGALSTQRQEDDARALKDRERIDHPRATPLATAPSQVSDK